MLEEEVPRDLEPNARIWSIFDPVWRTSIHQDPPGVVLSLRHEGLGWLGFHLPHAEAKALGEWLVANAQTSS